MTTSAGNPSINAAACGASPFWPAVSVNRTGHPRPRTTMCIFVLRPPRDDQAPDLQAPFFRPSGVLMRPDDGGIDNKIFEVRVIGHRLEYPPPNTLGAPSAEAPEYAVPVPERLRKVTPGRTGTHDPKHPFHEHPVVPPGRALLTRPPYDQRRHSLPCGIAQHQTIHHTQGCLQKRSLESDLLLKGNP